MENHETCLEAALRESEEEANTHINNPTLYGIFDLPHISQVYIFYQGEVIDGLFSPGIESLEVKLFKENDIPWKNLAFPVIDIMLQHHFKKIKHADICTATINKSWINNPSSE
jgi:8-oxo-dGTP pyrophosphatase MutT (NUDIX family)